MRGVLGESARAGMLAHEVPRGSDESDGRDETKSKGKLRRKR